MATLDAGVSAGDIVPIVTSLVLVALLWRYVIPRGLRGLKVAFQRTESEYEIHTLTKNTAEARELLEDQRVKFGVLSYMCALTGILMMLVEFMMAFVMDDLVYNQWVLFVALFLILVPSLSSIIASLDVQLRSKPTARRAELHKKSIYTRLRPLMLGIMWIIVVIICRLALTGVIDTEERLNAATIFLAFLPAVLAYGRVLGSSWLMLVANKMEHAKGNPTNINPEPPSRKGRILSTIVLVTAILMPITAINSLISLIITFSYPGKLIHSDLVFERGDIVQQTTIMEEGGVLGFYAIELFSKIEVDAIRFPLVAGVLLFLLLNIAVVGIAFVFEVARTLFLGVSHLSGRAGLKLADNKLIRTEREQQAEILNFCFSGFAGQSMLVLALALLTFWDSSYLPQGAGCGQLENNVCSFATKGLLEELTWMLASAGQVAFLLVWIISLTKRKALKQIKFDAIAVGTRSKIKAREAVFYPKHERVSALVRDGEITKALQRYEEMLYQISAEHNVIPKLRAEITLGMVAGRWASTEKMADKLLALEGGTDDFARLTLCAANLATRDYKEARHHLGLLPESSQERMILTWLGAILAPNVISFDMNDFHHIRISTVVRGNLELLHWYDQLEAEPDISRNRGRSPENRLLLLRDVCLLRIDNRSEDALDMLESWFESHDVEQKWVGGLVAKALSEFDCGLLMSALQSISRAHKLQPRNPMVKSALEALMEHPDVKQTWVITPAGAIDWPSLSTQPDSDAWNEEWLRRYSVEPLWSNAIGPNGVSQALRSNVWVAIKRIREHLVDPTKLNTQIAIMKNLIPIRDERPLGNHILMTGLIATVAGMPLDFGFPNNIDTSNHILKRLMLNDGE